MTRVYRVAFGLVAGLALLAGTAAAQVTNGQITGRVTDQSGAAVPGVTVTLESPALIRPMVDVTAVSGRYEFPIVPIGTYTVTFELTGFKKVIRQNVIIETGFQAEVNAVLEVGGLTETIEVSGAAPIVDTRKTSTGATFNREVMDNIPTARDPWQIINMAAGIQASDINVGGNLSGQQVTFTSRGTGQGDTMWNVEGATVTDMAATGASPGYFDFESFQEIQVTTGGGDASLQTGGVNINLVTRSGSNVFKGSGRIVYSDKNMQWRNVTRELYDQGASSGVPIKYYREWGGEAGGPVVRNQMWWWGAFARQDINGSVLNFYDLDRPECNPPPEGFENLKDNQDCLKDDITNLTNFNGKLNYQLNSANKFQFLYTWGDKKRNARGASSTRAPESVYRQTSGGPGSYNFKHTWVATDKLVFDTLVQYTGGGFNLIPQKGVEDQQRLVNRDTGFTSRGLYTDWQIIDRPTTEVKTDSSYFFSNLLGGDHTTKFGIRYRNTPWQTDRTWTGHAEARFSSRGYATDDPGPRIDSQGRVRSIGSTCDTCPLTPDRAQLRRPSTNPTGLFTIGAYLQDNYTKGRLRLNLGVRWDYQNDEAKAGCVDENPILPDLLNAQCFEGADRDVNFSDISPRISATYDLFGTGKTVLKGGFAQYYGQGVGLSGGLSLLGTVVLTFQNTTTRTCWDDANGDQYVQREELNLTDPLCITYPSTFDPETGLRTQTLNEVDPNLKNDRTTEFTAGVEHELFPNFAVGVNYIHRLFDRGASNIRIGETKDMWVARTWNEQDFIDNGEEPPSQFGLPTTGWVYYEFDPTIIRPTNITRTENNPEERHYDGVDFTVTKRFSDRWMANAAITVQQNVTDPDFCFDCTNVDKSEGLATGTRYLIKINGMYAFPGGWNASANLQIQQGGNRGINFDGPSTRSGGLNSSGTSLLNLGGTSFTAYPYGTVRYPQVHLLDAQLTKSFDLRGGQNRLNLIFSVFNVTNANTIRSQTNDLNSTNFDVVSNILAPRVARIQASITF